MNYWCFGSLENILLHKCCYRISNQLKEPVAIVYNPIIRFVFNQLKEPVRNVWVRHFTTKYITYFPMKFLWYISTTFSTISLTRSVVPTFRVAQIYDTLALHNIFNAVLIAQQYFQLYINKDFDILTEIYR